MTTMLARNGRIGLLVRRMNHNEAIVGAFQPVAFGLIIDGGHYGVFDSPGTPLCSVLLSPPSNISSGRFHCNLTPIQQCPETSF